MSHSYPTSGLVRIQEIEICIKKIEAALEVDTPVNELIARFNEMTWKDYDL